jgi:hypothetical protein
MSRLLTVRHIVVIKDYYQEDGQYSWPKLFKNLVAYWSY